jgi:hypothetical protein
MATNRWLGHAPATAKVVTLTVGGTAANGDTVKYTINGKTITATAASMTTITLAAALAALLQASTIPEFVEITWDYTAGDAFVTGTAATAGVPFTGTASATGGTTLTQATVTASNGPNHVDSTGNWSLAALPGAADDVLIDGGSDGLWGFENISAAAYNSFKMKASFEGRWGLPFRNDNDYVEYRGRAWPLATAITTVFGEGVGNGVTFANFTIATAAAVTVYKTGQRAEPNVPALNLSGMSSGTVSVVTGDVGVAADDPTLSGTVTTGKTNEGTTLTVGIGATVTTLNEDGGSVDAAGTVTTLNITAGDATLYVAPTTITSDGGTVVGRFTGTVTTLTFRGQGNPQNIPVLDLTTDERARTATNGSFTGGARLLDPDKSLTMSNAFTFDRESLKNSDLGARFSILRT